MNRRIRSRFKVNIGDCLKISNLQVSSYKNTKRLKSTHLTKIEPSKREIKFDYKKSKGSVPKEVTLSTNIISVDETSLAKTFICSECGEKLDTPTGKLITCSKCHTILIGVYWYC